MKRLSVLFVVLVFSFASVNWLHSTLPDDLAKMLAKYAKKSPGKRLKALAEISDQALLAEIVKTDPEQKNQETALRKLTDQSLLADVLKNASSDYIRTMAAERVEDQSVLAEIAKLEKIEAIRIVALKKITNQAILAELALKDPSSKVRYVATQGITDQAILIQLAKYDQNEGVREAVTKKIIDPKALEEIAKIKASFPPIRNLRWKMTKTEVQKSENNSLTEDSQGNLVLNQPGDYQGIEYRQIVFAFKDSQLMGVAFINGGSLSWEGSEAFAAVEFVLCAAHLMDVYGKPAIDEPLRKVWNRGIHGNITHSLVKANSNEYVHTVVFTAPGVVLQ